MADRSHSPVVARGGGELWDPNSSTCVWKYQGPIRQSVVRVMLSSQMDLAACLGSSRCSLVDAVSGETSRPMAFSPSLRQVQNNAAWATDETRLLTCDEAGYVCVWDVASARESKQVHLFFHSDTKNRTTSARSSIVIGALLRTTASFPYLQSIARHTPQPTSSHPLRRHC